MTGSTGCKYLFANSCCQGGASQGSQLLAQVYICMLEYEVVYTYMYVCGISLLYMLLHVLHAFVRHLRLQHP